MKKIIAAAVLALGIAVGAATAPVQADDDAKRPGGSVSIQRAIDWM